MQVNLPTLATISDTPTHIPDNIMPNLNISQHGIQNLLSMLDVQKASGPDLISPYILKHCANEIAPILQVISLGLYLPVHCQMTGYQLTSVQCLKRVTVVVLLITDLYP